MLYKAQIKQYIYQMMECFWSILGLKSETESLFFITLKNNA